MITVRLFAAFRENRFKEKELDFPDGGRLADVLDQLRIPAEEVGILLVNGNSASPETTVGAGDSISVFPAIGGG